METTAELPSEDAAHRVYHERCARFAAERDALARRSNQLSNVRLLLFFAAAVCAGVSFWAEAPIGLALAGLLLVGFVVLVVQHRRVEQARRRADGLWRINDEALRRLRRAWDGLPVRHTMPAEPEHPYAADLDLFGRASLFHLLESLGTRMGEATLGEWLLRPAAPETVRERQAAVAELAPRIDLRDELTWRGRALGDTRPDPELFLAWAEGPSWLSRRRLLRWAARISPILLWTVVLAQGAGLLEVPLWPIFLVTNLALNWIPGGTAYAIVARVAGLEQSFGSYAGSLGVLSTTTFTAPMLRRLQAALDVDGVPAPEHVRRLQRIAGFALPRSALVYFPIQMATLWDFHVLDALERWQVRAGPRARGWLSTLGEAEALAALAIPAHDNPDWVFPEIDPRVETLESRGLGHPLLARGVRVANDLTIGPVGTFLLVTGSNMSGKSTLLRAVGVNVVLAQAGGPVCAAQLRMPPIALWTSMRAQDSLAEGVSYFMAELRRLKQIVDAAYANDTHADGADSDGTPADRAVGVQVSLYLLDEILQGTNTHERQIAARRIIRLLLPRAIGAVSTHDLTLADAPDLAAASRAVHLTELVADDSGDPRMSFDYTLRPGVATSTNALRLLELVGLPSEEPTSP